MKPRGTKISASIAIWLTLWLVAAVAGYSQIRSGATFLNMMPGSRQQALGSSLSGGIDDFQSFYANPAAIGFYREYHFCGSYTRWFADIYHLSLNAGKRFQSPLSRRTQLVFGLRYLGVKKFDSTLRNRAMASASDMLASFGLGTPLSFLSDNFAIGVNLKYLQSELYTFRASSFNADAGILWRSPRFQLRNPLFEYAHLSAGISLSHWGQSLRFKNTATPLPQTMRFGIAVAIGSHDGLQLQLSSDYQKTKDESGYFNIGGELSFAYRFSLQAGYHFDDHFLSKFSMGMSFRLDNNSKLARQVVRENSALRFDFAGLEKNEFFSASYRGSASAYPVAPEAFRLITPAHNDTFAVNKITFAWEKSKDPDLYDDVSYLFLLEKQENAAELSALYRWQLHSDESIKEMKTLLRFHAAKFFRIDTLRNFSEKGKQIAHSETDLPAGDYWWTVLAVDRDDHFRVAEQGVRHFYVLFPDIKIKEMQFKPSPWITESDTQGVISVTLANVGHLDAENINLVVSTISPRAQLDTFLVKKIDRLNRGDSLQISIPWLTPEKGKFIFSAEARILKSETEMGLEVNLANNHFETEFYTIPKGRLDLPDTVNAYLLPRTDHNLPLLPRVFFDANSASMPLAYYQSTENWLYPPLKIIAERLKKRHDLYLELEGFCDNTSGEPLELARERVYAVRNLLLQFGISEEQIPDSLCLWNRTHYQRPTWNKDVREERRFVKITAYNVDTHEADITLFAPIPFKTFEEPAIPLPVKWGSTIKSQVGVEDGYLSIRSPAKKDFLPYRADVDSIDWPHSEKGKTDWLNQPIAYFASLKDSLGRQFKTRPQRSYLTGFETHMPIVVGLADFNNQHPYPIIPWDDLFAKLELRLKWMKNTRIRFVGHACGIPPNTVNNIFSRKRAANFQAKFLAELEKRKYQNPELYRLIYEHLDINGIIGKGSNNPFSYSIDTLNFLNNREDFEPGCYEHIRQLLPQMPKQVMLEPFVLILRNDQITLIGDNATPEGRQINRRIEMEFYTPKSKKQLALQSGEN